MAASGRGFYQLIASYEAARVQTAARGVGVAQAAFECAVKYAKDRKQFGQPIGDFQVIGKARAHGRRNRSRPPALLLRRRQKDTASDATTRPDWPKRSPRDGRAGHTRGDAGARRLRLLDGVEAQRFWRDARVLSIFEGTSEIESEDSAGVSWSRLK